MRKPVPSKLRGAPLASFESFLSLETRLEEGNTMRQQWNDNDVNQREEGDIDEPWMNAEFNQLTRRQQNCEIYRVVASAVLSMSSEVKASRSRLEELLAKKEQADAERDLGEADNVHHQEMQIQRTQHQNHNNTHHYQDNGKGQGEETEDTQGWPFSPRSNSPTEFHEPDPDMATIARHKILNPKVVINIGGVKHEVMWKMLEKRPLTRLGMLAKARTHEDILKLVDAYSLVDNEIYFDRDPGTFNSILNFYRTDHLHVIDEICVLDFAEDLEFWMIKEINLEICCVDKFNTRRDHILAEVEKAKRLQEVEVEVEEDFGDGYFVQYQKALWDLFEKPQSSFCAKLISLLSIGLVLVSTVGMCLNTFPWMQAQDVNGDPVDNPKLALIEAVCISYFSIEYLLRLAGSPVKWDFMKGTMNVIDCMAIAPYYLTLFFVPHPEMGPVDESLPTVPPGMEEEEESGFGNVGRIMQVFRIARIMRIFKLARRSVGLQSIAHTVRTSWKDLGLLFMLVGMGMLVFGSLEYFIENEEEGTGFTSIPQGMWWAVQTLTSLGYGDFWPHTLLGKTVGSMCAVCGVLVMALPIPIVVDNFADYYSEQKKIEAKELKKEAQAKQAELDAAGEQVANIGLIKTLCNTPGAFRTPPLSPHDGITRTRQNGTLHNKF
eukprot:TRINITY_DN19509_c0_g1_i1.p1 TRINITY_DN19509_c0_g1~~TRINITY_DN19509_c0_g1_i1.p1  ORF type:complete len:662 (-),score=160.28 TRINITY_DN19509_c0_g1_i1:257-2242(-)